MRVVSFLFLQFILLITPIFVFSQDSIRSDTASKKTKLVEDDAVMAMLDSLATLKVFADASSPH